jgi:hypothetical protein
MATIGSVGAESGMSTLLQGLSQPQSGRVRMGRPSEAQRAEFEKKFEEAAKAAGLDVDKLKSIQGDIQAAISTTIEGYGNLSDQSGLQDAIQKAVNDVLTKNGFDPATVKQQLESARDSMGMKNGKMMGPPPPPPPAEKSDSATSSTDTGNSTTGTASNRSLMGLLRLLEGAGESTGQGLTQDSTSQNLATLLGLNILA